MRTTFAKLKRMMQRGAQPASGDALDIETVKKMARGIATTYPDEIGCEECFEQMDQFVEIALTGKNAAEAMPLVRDHLERCRDCHEEFEALLAALQAMH